ncbi:hypothetical protein Acor_82100 [Acrocarpospora corrugata]|uniref:Uncharacterized protein n=2 Tax=Acrocarpospora corrugata TaxID=35763 RepID=A0A5M3WGC1_9ACTN|nr:hypothetical protein Acor_82100 [Acrocarpospora corrugata]
MAGLDSALAVVSLLATLDVVQGAEERDLARSRQVAADARGQLQADPELALLLARRAVEIRPTAEAVAVSPDGRRLASSGQDGTVGIINSTSTASPDGRHVATTSNDGTERIQECVVCGPLGEVLTLAAAKTTRTLTPDEITG